MDNKEAAMDTCGWCGGPWNKCGCNANDGEGQRNFDEVAPHAGADDDDTYEPVETRHSFEILEEKLNWFKKRMEQLAKRAAKMGVEAPSYEIGEAFDVKETRSIDSDPDYEGEPRAVTVIVRKHHVEVIGCAPRYAGWTFAATLQHLEGGETLVRNIAKIEAPVEYRNAGQKCDHCKSTRRRNDTFLVVHDDGTWKQVGSSCIGDFLGADSPQKIAAQAEYIAEALGFGAAGGLGSKDPDRVSIEDFLPIVAAVMNAFGWVSRTKAKEEERPATADLALDVALPPKGQHKPLRNPRTKVRIIDEITADCTARATAAAEWVRDLSDADLNEYLHNCRAIVRSGAVEHRTAGYAASVLIAYDKHMDRVRARAARPESNHVGTVGERQHFTVTQVTVKEINGDFGCSFLHLFSDAAGNDLRWFGSGRLWKNGSTAGSGPMVDQVKDGETIEIVATVKKHDEYKGRKQTQITRCSVYIVPLEKPKKNKTTKAVAQGLVDLFQAIMEPWFVATGIVEAFQGLEATVRAQEQQFAWDLYYMFSAMFNWYAAVERRAAQGVVDMFRDLDRNQRGEAALVGDGIAAFLHAARYYDPRFPAAMGHPSSWRWNYFYYPKAANRY